MGYVPLWPAAARVPTLGDADAAPDAVEPTLPTTPGGAAVNPLNVDAIAKLFADRRFSRRAALSHGGAGLAAGALATTGLATEARAQEATPTPEGEKAEYLFVQSFESGAIAPKAGEDGTYTLTLEHGLGQ